MRILKFLVALLVAAAALTAGVFVFAIVAAVVIGALLIRWGLRRFGLGGPPGAVAARELPNRTDVPASEATIDVVATESPAQTIEPGDLARPANPEPAEKRNEGPNGDGQRSV